MNTKTLNPHIPGTLIVVALLFLASFPAPAAEGGLAGERQSAAKPAAERSAAVRPQQQTDASQAALPNTQSPHIRDGVLDLRTYSFEQQGPVKLDGQWEFFWNQLISPTAEAQGSTAPFLMPLPGMWSDSSLSTSKISEYGYGTYCLEVLLPEEHPETFGLRFGFIGSAARLYVNNELVYRAGRVGQTPQESVPEWRPAVVDFQTNQQRLDIVLQVSNFHDRTGGVVDSIQLGTVSQAYQHRINRMLYDMFLFGALIIMSIYHLGLYYFRRSDASPLFFALLTLVLAFRIILYEELMILRFFPDMHWALIAKLGYLTFSLAVLFFFRFIHSLFPEHVHRPVLRGIDLIALLYTLVIAVTPATLYMRLLVYFQFFTIAVALYVFYVLFKAVKTHKAGAGLFIIGFSFLFAATVHDIMKTYMVLPTIFLVPFGLLLFIFFQSMVMTKKFANAFRQSEEMAAHLWRLNQSMERFVPREFLRFLKKDNVMEIELGDHASHRMTVLFADIRDFTSLSEKLTPEENFRFINSFLNRMGPIIRDHHGFVDKYMGDGIMALFPDRAEDAVEAAIHLREELVRYNHDRGKMDYQPINFGVGLHTGDLMLGTIGENRRMDGTVISDAVNLASRIEALTKKLAIGIAVSEATYACLASPDSYEIRYVGKEWVKGKSKEISIFEVAGRRPLRPD
ncbi:MAG: adenylate/guanylate cyclase domain-containing protein [Spirochaetota bacterium]